MKPIVLLLAFAASAALASPVHAGKPAEKGKGPAWVTVKKEMPPTFRNYFWTVTSGGKPMDLTSGERRLTSARIRLPDGTTQVAKVRYRPLVHMETPLSHVPGAREPVAVTDQEPFVVVRLAGMDVEVPLTRKGLKLDASSLRFGKNK